MFVTVHVVIYGFLLTTLSNKFGEADNIIHRR